MTTINATILEDRIICGSDTLITRTYSNNNNLDKLVEKSKKIVEGKFNSKPLISSNDQTYNLLFGFAGSVSLNSNLKSRVNLDYTFGSINDHKSRKTLEMSLEEVIYIYKEIFENIISNILFLYKEPLNIHSNSFKETINTEIIIMGYCQINKEFQIYKLSNQGSFELNIECFNKIKEVVTIGCKKNIIKDKIQNNINDKNISPNGELNIFYTSIFNEIIDPENRTIGGDLSAYSISKKDLIEEISYVNNKSFHKDIMTKLEKENKNHLKIKSVILNDIMSSHSRVAGINIKLQNGYLPPSFGITLDLDILNIENYLEHFQNSFSKEYNIYLFLKNNNLKLKKLNNNFILVDNKEEEVVNEDILYEWTNLSYYNTHTILEKDYYYYLINHLINNTDIFTKNENIFYIISKFN